LDSDISLPSDALHRLGPVDTFILAGWGLIKHACKTCSTGQTEHASFERFFVFKVWSTISKDLVDWVGVRPIICSMHNNPPFETKS